LNHSTLYYPTAVLNKAAITLVAHGLNVQPAAMLPLIQWLNSQGSDVFLIVLSGHYKGSISIKEVTATIWLQEMAEGYNQAKTASQEQSLPLYFLGYSLGALLGQSMIAAYQQPPAFDKQVLIAPATALRRRTQLVKMLFFLGSQFQLPSFTPKDYRYSKLLPLSIYRILFAEAQKLIQSQYAGLNIPTLIMMDPKDELISYAKLSSLINAFHLTNYQFLALDSSLKGRNSHYHHLLLNEPTMGTANWEKATSKMKAFLFTNDKGKEQ
jgi:esterase/lipase